MGHEQPEDKHDMSKDLRSVKAGGDLRAGHTAKVRARGLCGSWPGQFMIPDCQTI